MYLLLFFACTSETPRSPVAETSEAPTPTWDAVADAVVCTPGGAAALLDAAFADADLDRSEFGYTDSEWDAWGSLVDTGWELSWYNAVHHEPETVPCFAGQVQADVDASTALSTVPCFVESGANRPDGDPTARLPMDFRR